MKNYIWVGESSNYEISLNKDEAVNIYKELFSKYKECNLDGVIFNGNNKFWREALDISYNLGLEFHIWKPIMISSDSEIERANAGWFAVSRDGVSAVKNPPYVDYYKWLCPNNTDVRQYILNLIDSYIDDPRISSMHLDYIRYCDQYIAEGLLNKYGLESGKYYPEFDFCYCKNCVDKFKSESGIDPMKELGDSEKLRWHDFRIDSLNKLVKSIKKHLKSKGVKVSAAVFPGPGSIAEPNVRQKWSDWDLDAYFPMNYNSFYNQDINWIGDVVKEARETVNENTMIYSGLYLDKMSAADFKLAIEKSIEFGANGVSLYADNLFSSELMKTFKEVTSKFK